MDFDNASLRPGEFAFYLCGNRAVDASRFASLLRCFAWVGPEAIEPAYDLDIIELRKGSIFARFALRWRDESPTNDQLDHMVLELERLRTAVGELNGTVVSAITDRAEADRRAGRKSDWALALTVAGLVYTVAHDFLNDAPNECASALAELMEKDSVPAIYMWSPDCTFRIGNADVPEARRRATVHKLEAVGIEAGAAEVGRQSLGVQPESADVPFPQSAHFSSGADVPLTIQPQSASSETGAGSPGPVVGIRPRDSTHGHVATEPKLPQARGLPYQAHGVFSFFDGLMIFKADDRADGTGTRSAILIPPEQYMFGEGQRYEVKGRFIEIPGDYDLVIADSIVLLS
ncbi:MAG: hypothetical protein ACREB7_16115 [Sphingopyxis sp.]|uniref:hypothetical protein n=1 Tax=Sphingopyxis sp. TaxID=1908224 RepID=UPI003D6CB824